MTALAPSTLKVNGDSALSAKPSDVPNKLFTGHALSYTNVRDDTRLAGFVRLSIFFAMTRVAPLKDGNQPGWVTAPSEAEVTWAAYLANTPEV